MKTTIEKIADEIKRRPDVKMLLETFLNVPDDKKAEALSKALEVMKK